jgi:hypothetical protein
VGNVGCRGEKAQRKQNVSSIALVNAKRCRSDSGLESSAEICEVPGMSKVKEIESALARLSLEDLQEVRHWLDDFIEDQLEVSDAFKGKIQRAKQEIASGVYSRARKPETGE